MRAGEDSGDRFTVGGAEVGDRLRGDFVAVGFVGVDGVLEVVGGGQVAANDQGVAVGLGCLIFVVVGSDLAAVGVEDESAQDVEGFATVELAADAAAERFVGVPAQGVHGAEQFAVFEQRLGEGVLSGTGLRPGDQQCGRDVAVEQGAADAEQIVPIFGD